MANAVKFTAGKVCSLDKGETVKPRVLVRHYPLLVCAYIIAIVGYLKGEDYEGQD